MLELKEKEEIVETIKKSLFVLLKPFLKSTILVTPGIYLLFIVDNAIVNLVSFAWIIVVVSYLFYHILNWNLDRYYITTQRIIEVKNKGVFYKYYTEFPLERIDNFKCHLEGILSSIFDYGSVNISSISKTNLILENIPEPRRIYNLISEVKEGVKLKDLT